MQVDKPRMGDPSDVAERRITILWIINRISERFSTNWPIGSYISYQ